MQKMRCKDPSALKPTYHAAGHQVFQGVGTYISAPRQRQRRDEDPSVQDCKARVSNPQWESHSLKPGPPAEISLLVFSLIWSGILGISSMLKEGYHIPRRTQGTRSRHSCSDPPQRRILATALPVLLYSRYKDPDLGFSGKPRKHKHIQKTHTHRNCEIAGST